jgi:Tfp pilus assembly protein PilO
MAVATYKDTVKRFVKSPQKKTYTFLGVTLILIAGLIFGAIRPTLKTIVSLRKEIKQRQQIDTQLQQKIDTLNALQRDYKRLEDDLDMLNYYYPEDSDYSLLMANMEYIVKSFGYELNSIHIESADDAEAETGQYSMVPVGAGISITGSPADLVDLLEYMEGLPVVMYINRITYSPGERNGVQQVQVRISFTMYRKSSDTESI